MQLMLHCAINGVWGVSPTAEQLNQNHYFFERKVGFQKTFDSDYCRQGRRLCPINEAVLNALF